MGLALTVGSASDVLDTDFAKLVAEKIEQKLKYKPEVESNSKPYHSDELAWSGWAELQERAASLLGEDAIPNLLSVDAWTGVFIPKDISPTELVIQADVSPFQVASLAGLYRELLALSQKASWPNDEQGLQAWWDEYMDGDSAADEDDDIQTYIQLMLCTLKATNLNKPLWVVK